MPTTMPHYVIQDVTAFVIALSGLVGGLVVLVPMLLKLGNLRKEITVAVGEAKISAAVADTKSEANAAQITENRRIATSQLQAMAANVVAVAQSQTPPATLPAVPKFSDFQAGHQE